MNDWMRYCHAAQLGELAVVDVRSPFEFQLGALPGAVNIPLFSDDERAAIGTTYRQEGQKSAVALGLEYFAARSATTLEDFARVSQQGSLPIYIYCARGGMRSRSMATFLKAAGMQVTILAGGYKTFRHQVLDLLQAFALHPLLVINGRTGSGKTAFLRQLPGDLPMIDLEDIAKHRGSAFGDFNIDAPQPTQQNFENLLALAYWQKQDADLLVVEIENNIGNVQLPSYIRSHVSTSPMLCLTCSKSVRVQRILQDYVSNWDGEKERLFLERLTLFQRHFSKDFFAQLHNLTAQQDFATIVECFLDKRYDPRYDKSLDRYRDLIVADVDVSEGFGAAVEAARRIRASYQTQADGTEHTISP